MQLKRDTDYAIRILLVMAQLHNENMSKKWTVKELSERTSVPGRIVIRLCQVLSEAGFMVRDESSQVPAYYPGSDLAGRTLLSIIDAIEGQSNLLAVFDKRTDIYRRFGLVLESINDSFVGGLDTVSLQDIITWAPQMGTFAITGPQKDVGIPLV